MGAVGARMIGGGFGGWVLVLDKKEKFIDTYMEIQKSYQQSLAIL